MKACSRKAKIVMTTSDNTFNSTDGTVAFKLQAKRLRAAMAAQGTPLSHAAALELVATQHGARDWNTLSASVSTTKPADDGRAGLAVGAQVSGRYLDQAFTGRVLSLSEMPSGGHRRVTIHFDEPVDVVTFESFSAYRRRITAVIGKDGISPRRTSNGMPHLILDR